MPAAPVPAHAHAEARHDRLGAFRSASSDPLYVLDENNDLTLPANGTPINSFSSWAMSLEAQVSGAGPVSHSAVNFAWDLSKAPDAVSATGVSSYNLQSNWLAFTGPARTDTIAVTESQPGYSSITQAYTCQVAGTDAPAQSAAPTSAGTWPNVMLLDEWEADVAAGRLPDFGRK